MLLEAGELILERLRQKCPSVGDNVFSTEDLKGVQEASQVAPALHVVPFGYVPADQAGGDVLWNETWLVVAVVKHVGRKDRVMARQSAAVPILAEALAALSGWRVEVSGSVSGLSVVPGPRPMNSASHAYFPLAFAVSSHSKGCEEAY